MKTLLLVFAVTLTTRTITAQVDISTVDSLIVGQTSPDFFRCLQFSRVFKQEILDFHKLNESNRSADSHEMPRISVTTFEYYFVTASEVRFYYRDAGHTSCILEVNFDKNNIIVNGEQLAKLGNVASIYDAKVIGQESAIHEAKSHLTTRKVKPGNCHLIYDLATYEIYWEVRSTFGFRNKTEETARVNALTGEFIRLDKIEYRRGFLQ
jgi:hypothetical protein